MPNSVNHLNHTTIFEWYYVWCDTKNKYHIDMSLKEIGLHYNHSRIKNLNQLGGPTRPLNKDDESSLS